MMCLTYIHENHSTNTTLYHMPTIAFTGITIRLPLRPINQKQYTNKDLDYTQMTHD